MTVKESNQSSPPNGPFASGGARRTITLAILVALCSGGAGTGCRRIRQWVQRHRHQATRVARATHVVPPTRDAGPPASCEGARETAASILTLQTAGPVQSLAIASLNPRQTVILVAAGDAIYSTTLASPSFLRLSPGDPGDHDSEPEIVRARDGFAALWHRNRADAQFQVFARIDGRGAIEGTEHAQQLDTGRPGTAVTAIENGYAYGFVTAGAIGVQFVGLDGANRGPAALLPGSSGSAGIALAPAPPDALAAWTTETPQRSTVTVARVFAAGSIRPLSALQVHSGRARARLLAVGQRFVMSLFDPAHEASPNVFTTAFESSGVRLVDPIALGDHALDAPPAVATDGERVAAAWTEEPAAGTTRVRWIRLNDRGERQGEPLDVAGSTQSGAPRVPVAMAWDGEAFVLVRPGATPESVAVHRFGPNGCDAR